MNRIRQGWDALRRGRRSGVSLVIALCAVAVLIGLSLSIVYSSSMLLSRANRKIGRERCYQLAQSFAQVLDSEQNPADRTGRFPYAEKDQRTAEISAQTFIRYQLSVSVRVEKGADSFTYTTEYYRRDGFQPIYTWEGEGGSITPVYWVSRYFSRSHSIADRLEPKTDEDGQTENVFISYRYDPGYTTYKKYEPVNKPAGGAAE